MFGSARIGIIPRCMYEKVSKQSIYLTINYRINLVCNANPDSRSACLERIIEKVCKLRFCVFEIDVGGHLGLQDAAAARLLPAAITAIHVVDRLFKGVAVSTAISAMLQQLANGIAALFSSSKKVSSRQFSQPVNEKVRTTHRHQTLGLIFDFFKFTCDIKNGAIISHFMTDIL